MAQYIKENGAKGESQSMNSDLTVFLESASQVQFYLQAAAWPWHSHCFREGKISRFMANGPNARERSLRLGQWR